MFPPSQSKDVYALTQINLITQARKYLLLINVILFHIFLQVRDTTNLQDINPSYEYNPSTTSDNLSRVNKAAAKVC